MQTKSKCPKLKTLREKFQDRFCDKNCPKAFFILSLQQQIIYK